GFRAARPPLPRTRDRMGRTRRGLRVKLTVVGCSGSFPGPDSPASCYLVEEDGCRVVLDLGNGALGRLQRHVSLDDVDAVIISHLHVDHVIDLCSYYVARRYRPDGPLAPLRVIAP